jgi:glycosyltransferase involved in cell wall biosynthesis
VRILVVSSSFGTGGYGRHCAEVSGYLAEMGHTLHVLTCPGEKAETKNGIEVTLTLARDPNWDSSLPGYAQFFLYHRRRERHNIQVLRQIIHHFKPDLLFVWQGTGLHRSLFVEAERLGYPVVYRLCDYWPSVPDEYLVYWQKTAERGYFRLLKLFLTPLALWLLRRWSKPGAVNFDYSICVSDAVCQELRQAGVSLKKAKTIFNGINLQMFLNDLSELTYPRRRDGVISLLYGGGLLEHKGVHIAIEAIHHLRTMPESPAVQLTIIGEGPAPYVAHLHSLIHKWQLTDQVRFESPIPREEMPAMLRQFDVLLFPSLYEEPLARMMQEAMAAGVVVVGTTTGGSKEILQDGQNSLVANAGDAQDMVRQIQRLTDPILYQTLASEGQQTVLEECDIYQTTKDVASYLEQTVLEKRI